MTLPENEIEPIVGNKRIEDAAIRFVIEQERRFGREARDTRYRGAAADLESGGRVIEVKAVGGKLRGYGLPLEPRQVDEGRANPDFYVYIVENVVQGDPAKFELRVLGGDQLRRLLANAREHRYYEVPVPVAEYAKIPKLDR
jgi:hypothetical protein